MGRISEKMKSVARVLARDDTARLTAANQKMQELEAKFEFGIAETQPIRLFDKSIATDARANFASGESIGPDCLSEKPNATDATRDALRESVCVESNNNSVKYEIKDDLPPPPQYL